MEGELGLRAPLLDGRESAAAVLRRTSTASSTWCEFVSQLPDKLRAGVDPEDPFDVDFSAVRGLTLGEKLYYKRQFATLKSFEEVDSLCTASKLEGIYDQEDYKGEEHAQDEEFAIKISNFANIFLLVLKIYATVKTGSTAVAASTLDSLLDLIGGAILWYTHLSIKRADDSKFPIGRFRLQPITIVVFATIMATLGIQVLIRAIEELVVDGPLKKLCSVQLMWLYFIMITATAVKLALWLSCRNSKNNTIQAYSKGHYFNAATNIVGLVAAVLGDEFFWWIDPVGAIALALCTILNWSKTVLESAVSLVGESASPEMLQNLIYLIKLDPRVKHVDTVRAYTFGALYFVEADVRPSEEIPLKEAQAIGGALQKKIERLPEIERAFTPYVLLTLL